MAEAFEKLTSFFMTPKCHEELFYKFNFINVVCLKMIISKCLGYGILAGSVLLRVPQIFKIVKANSAEGMSVPSELLQQIAVFGTMSYGFSKQFPISAYGDSYFLFLQGFIILLLVLFYQQKIASLIVVLVLILGSTGLLFLNMIPYEVFQRFFFNFFLFIQFLIIFI
jgi:mannose-P-dolichol utilization defect protein 1